MLSRIRQRRTVCGPGRRAAGVRDVPARASKPARAPPAPCYADTRAGRLSRHAGTSPATAQSAARCDVVAGSAAPVSLARRRAAGLCLAEVGARGRAGRVSRPLGRGLQDRAVALRLAKGAGRQDRLVRRARPAGHDADHARRRLHANRRRVEQGRLRQLAARASS